MPETEGSKEKPDSSKNQSSKLESSAWKLEVELGSPEVYTKGVQLQNLKDRGSQPSWAQKQLVESGWLSDWSLECLLSTY